MELREKSAQQLLLAISRIQSLFIEEVEPESVCRMMLQELLNLTGSEHGIVGEVLQDTGQKPYFQAQAITALALNEEVRVLPAQAVPNLELGYLKVLCEQVMTTGQPVVVNDRHACGFLFIHSSVSTLVGLPIYRGKQLTGVVGLADRPGGYDEAGIAYLNPFLSTCAQLFEGFRNRRLRTEAEEALRESEDRFRVAIKGANEGIWDWDLITNDVYFSPRWKSMLGYEDHEIVSAYQEWESRLHPQDRDGTLAALNRCLRGTAEQYDVEFRLRKKNEEYCWIRACGSVSYDDDGKPTRMAGSHTDITERKRIEALQDAEKEALELVAKKETLESVLGFICKSVETLAPPMLCSVMLADDEGTHLLLATAPNLPRQYNEAIKRIPIGPKVGCCGSAAHFRRPAIASDVATNPLWKDFASVALTNRLKACWSLPIISSTSNLLGTLAVYHCEPREPQPTDLKILGRVSQIAAIAIEHTRMTEALRESEARFQSFMHHSPAVTLIRDENGQCLYVNSQFEMRFGVSREDVQSKTLFDLMPVDIATRLAAQDRTVLDSGVALETEEYIPIVGGEIKCWLVNQFPLNMSNKRLLGIVAVDITERKALERAAQDQADRLRLAMDIAKLATWHWDLSTNKIRWSENCEEVKGLPRGSFDGTFEAYQRLVHPEDLPTLLADIEKALIGQKLYRTEHRIVPPTGEIQWIEGNGVVYRDELNRPIRMVGTARNITEQKRME